MSSLFIIGNGFDLSHGLKTSYNDFRRYLLNEYPDAETNGFIEPSSMVLPDGDIKFNKEEVISMLIYLIDEAENNDVEWHGVENSLGYLNFDEAFDWYEDIIDKEGDIDYWKTAQRNEDIATNLVIPTLKVQELFIEWIWNISLSLIEPKLGFKKLLQDQDQFLTFNYTGVLEYVYGIAKENVCHIHGTQNQEIFFGHGNDTDYTDYYMGNYIGSENELVTINNQLRKRTDKALSNNLYFFEQLDNKNIKQIYSFGFSFNTVDMIYLEDICKRLNTYHITWYFNDYDNKSINEWSYLLREIGFKGKYNTFHVN